jgi:hypothetical protein
MNLFDGMMEASKMSEGYEATRQETQDNLMYPDPNQWVDAYNNFKMEPVLFPNVANVTVSPYPEDNWGDVSSIMMSMGVENLQFPQRDNKIDPNKIFTSDIAALRSLAADQMRVTKLFEKRLTESLRDKDKFGLNEADILAMQALTAARSAVTAINKEQIQIKKNIADIRLKQQQNRGMTDGGSPTTNNGESAYTNTNMIGRQIMDSLFDAVGTTVNTSTYSVEQSSLEQADAIIDQLVQTPTSTAFETLNPTTYAIVDESGNAYGYETYADNGQLIPEYDNPHAGIVSTDIVAGVAIDDVGRRYPIKMKD